MYYVQDINQGLERTKHKKEIVAIQETYNVLHG